MTESTTKGFFKTTTRPVALSWLQWLAAKSNKNKKTTTTTTTTTSPTTTSTMPSTTTTTTTTTPITEKSASTTTPPAGLMTVQYIQYRAPTTTATEKLVPLNAPPGFEYPGPPIRVPATTEWSWWMPDVGTEEGEDPSWESGATTQIEGLADTFPGEGEESGERVKNEAKEESGGEESAVDGNL